MKQRLWLLSVPFFLALCSGLFVHFFSAAKARAVRALHEQQTLHARQAARGIEEFFAGWTGLLGSLARIDAVIDLDDDGRRYLEFFLESHGDQIRALTRVDAAGRIAYTVPYNTKAIGSDISYQTHIQEILRDHRPVVSDVFATVQGYNAVALHVPVFRGGAFAGTLAAAFNFEMLAQRYLAVINVGSSGQAWLLSRDGTMIYSPVFGQTGESVFENHRQAPSVLRLAERMLRGESGAAEYVAAPAGGGAGPAVTHYAVYLPIRLGTTFWSIALATSEDEVLSSLVSYRNRLMLTMALLLAGGTLFAFYGAKAWVIVREERKRRAVEEALRESEERFRGLADSLPQTVFETDREGRVVYANRAGLACFGYTAADLERGLPFFDVIAPADRERARANVARRLRGEIAPEEYLALRRDGSVFPVIAHTAPVLRGGAFAGLRGIVFDITERKQAESALQASEARFRTIIERAREGILVVDAATKHLRYVNPELCRMLGYAQEQLHGAHLGRLLPEEKAARAVEAFERAALGDAAGVQLPCRRKDGSVFQADVRGTSLTYDAADCLAGFFTDVTDRRLLEEERLRSAKLEAIGTLAGGIAHDFNNLLQGIFGCISVAKQGIERGALPFTMLERAEGALRQSVSLATQLLTFSKGGQPLKRPLSLLPVVECATRFSLSGSRVGFHIDADGGLSAVEADEGQIAQVVQNIVLNAAQAMPDGGSVVIEARNVRVPGPQAPPLLAPGDFVAVSFRDSGGGIAPEHLDRIFDPYFTTKERGTGLGLATSQSIIRHHGGALVARSERGRGSLFTFFLPASAAAPVEAAPAPAVPRSPRPAKVLVMDDEPMVRTVAVEMLRLLGHQAAATACGEEAVEAYREARAGGSPFDLVLLDLTVRGGMGGEETLGALRAVDPGVTAVVSSGYVEGDTLAEYQARGFKACLRKPYQLEALNAVLCSLLC